MDEETSTLLEYDIVNLDRDMQDELRESIEKEGGFCMRKYENFCNALSNMKDIYNYEEPYDNVVLTGLVGLYEITFEQSWKMMKKSCRIMDMKKVQTGSPKIILKTAYKAGMIKDEELWLRALQARNNVTHSYNRKIAMGDYYAGKNRSFIKLFCELTEEIDRNWI